jgi:modification methylase
MTKKQSKSEVEKKRPLNFPNDFIDEFIKGDVLEILRQIPDDVIDLAVTSPPYNLKNSTGNGLKDGRGGKWASAALLNGYATYNDNMPYSEYIKWQRDILTEIMRVLSPKGAFFYNHKWRVQANLIQDRHEIIEGFPVRQIIIWQRAGGINFNPGYFLPTYEVIYMIAKPDFKLVPKANAVGDIWTFPQEMNNKHPAPFPVKLIDRIIGSTDAKIVLDPFMGSGTTAVAAKMRGRQFIGIDIAEEYCSLAEQRLIEFVETKVDC